MLPYSNLGGLAEVARALRLLRFVAQLFELRCKSRICVDDLLLAQPLRAASPSRLLAELGHLARELVETRLGSRRRAPSCSACSLDLELHERALDAVDLDAACESISILSLEAASSTRSMALSGRKRSVM